MGKVNAEIRQEFPIKRQFTMHVLSKAIEELMQLS